VTDRDYADLAGTGTDTTNGSPTEVGIIPDSG
jgi:hypothetical protein